MNTSKRHDLSKIYDFQSKILKDKVKIDRLWITEGLFQKIMDYLVKEGLITWTFSHAKSGSVTYYTLRASLFISYGKQPERRKYFSIITKTADGGRFKFENSTTGLMAALKPKETYQQVYDRTLTIEDFFRYIVSKYPNELISVDWYESNGIQNGWVFKKATD